LVSFATGTDHAEVLAIVGDRDFRCAVLHHCHHVLHRGLRPDRRPARSATRLHHICRSQNGKRVHMRYEIGHVVRHWVRDDLARGAALHDAATFHQGDAVADLEGLVEVVGHKDDRALKFRLQVKEFVLQFRADQRVQSRKGFVHQQDRRFGHKGAGKADALLHAAGKLTHQSIGAFGQVHEGKLGIDAGLAVLQGHPGKFQPKPDVFAHGTPW
jgi:hypothetical protein